MSWHWDMDLEINMLTMHSDTVELLQHQNIDPIMGWEAAYFFGKVGSVLGHDPEPSRNTPCSVCSDIAHQFCQEGKYLAVRSSALPSGYDGGYRQIHTK